MRGTVPQFINKDSGDEKVKLMFRPAGRYYDSYTAVYSGDKLLKRSRHRVLTPGEMCEIYIDRSGIDGDVTVKVEAE